MNRLIATTLPAQFFFRKCPLAALSFVLAIGIPNACIADQAHLLPGADANISELDFRYSVIGDPSLKPLRVYNNSITTTIEFAQTPDNKQPTLQIDGAGKYLTSTVKYVKGPDRLIVDGLFDSAVLIYSGTKKGSVTIERLVKTGTSSKGLILPANPKPVQAQPTVAELPVNPSPAPRIGGTAVVQSAPTPPTVKAEGFANPVTSGTVASSTPVLAAPKINVAPPKPLPPPIPTWTVSPQDKTIRETLAKWAASAGWTFSPLGRDYWTVPQDFDVVASDTFRGDFKDAVRKLIASTELTKTPLQPCFFSNRAVRVILINEECAAQASQGRNP